jgi:UDP-glucose 4-epimerase
MKILITGVAGFIGSHIAKRFVKEGYEVVGIDDLSNGKIENVPAGICFITGDLANKETIALLPADCKKILHLAGQSSGEISFDDPLSDLQRNTTSTLNLILYGIRNNVERIVYASSMSVYGPVPDEPIDESHETFPLSCYGVGKLASEGYLKVYQKKLPFVAMRMFNVYGPGQDLSNLRQGMVSIYIAQALSSGKIIVKGSTSRYRDLVYIDDVVEAWFRAATYEEAKNKTINLGTGEKTTVETLLQKICEVVPGAVYMVEDPTPGDQDGIYAENGQLREVLKMDSFVAPDHGISTFIAWAVTVS